MTDRIVRDPQPGIVDRIAEALFPWLGHPEAPEREAEAGS